MTTALCLNCGELKFGALCDCPVCEAPGTGNMDLDIAFSDHHVSAASLTTLGTVIRQLGAMGGLSASDRTLVLLALVQKHCPGLWLGRIALPTHVQQVLDHCPITIPPLEYERREAVSDVVRDLTDTLAAVVLTSGIWTLCRLMPMRATKRRRLRLRRRTDDAPVVLARELLAVAFRDIVEALHQVGPRGSMIEADDVDYRPVIALGVLDQLCASGHYGANNLVLDRLGSSYFTYADWGRRGVADDGLARELATRLGIRVEPVDLALSTDENHGGLLLDLHAVMDRISRDRLAGGVELTALRERGRAAYPWLAVLFPDAAWNFLALVTDSKGSP